MKTIINTTDENRKGSIAGFEGKNSKCFFKSSVFTAGWSNSLPSFSKVSDQRNIPLHRGIKVLKSSKEQLSLEVSILVVHFDHITQKWLQGLENPDLVNDLQIAHRALSDGYNEPMKKCGVSFTFKFGIFHPLHKTVKWLGENETPLENAPEIQNYFVVTLLKKTDPHLLDYTSGNGRLISTRAVSSIESNLDLNFMTACSGWSR